MGGDFPKKGRVAQSEAGRALPYRPAPVVVRKGKGGRKPVVSEPGGVFILCRLAGGGAKVPSMHNDSVRQ